MKRRAVLCWAGSAVLPPLAWPLNAAAIATERSPIRLGQSAPITGPLARVGTAFRDTARAVFAEATAAGGVAGRAIELVTLDDEDRPERTAVNVKLLASEYNVVGLFGFVGAGAHRAPASDPTTGSCTVQLVPFRVIRGGYMVATLRAGYRFIESWSLALNVDNLFDRRCYKTIGSVQFGNWYGAPRNWMLTLRGEL